MKQVKWVSSVLTVLALGLPFLSGSAAHASSLSDLINQLEGKTSCQTSNYPTFDGILKRRALIAKDKGMLYYYCLPNSPMAANCATFLEFTSLNNAQLQMKLATDLAFWTQVVTIDYNYALSKAGKNPAEAKYAMFLSMILQRSQIVDQALASGRQGETVFIGDSLMHIFEAYGQAEFPKSVFVGIGGDRTDSMLYRLAYHVGKIRPKNVVMSISGNDFLQSCKTQDIQKRRILIVNVLKSLGVQNIYWVSLPPLGDKKAAQGIPAQNALIASIPGVTYLDTWTAMAAPDGTIAPQYKGDGIHFNEQAYRDVWIPKFKALGL